MYQASLQKAAEGRRFTSAWINYFLQSRYQGQLLTDYRVYHRLDGEIVGETDKNNQQLTM